MLSKRNIIGLSLIILYISGFYLTYLFTGTTSMLPAFQDETDVLLIRLFVKSSLERGFFPLWIPNWYCGMPFLAYSHARAIYPLSLVFTLLELNQAVWVHQWLNVTIYSMGLFLLCRRLGASLGSALLALQVVGTLNIVFALGNYLPALCTGSWIPWLFLFTFDLVRNRRLSSFLGFVLVNGLMYWGGQIVLVGLTYEIIAVALLAWGIYARRRFSWVLAGYLVFSCAFVLGYLAGQAQALPTFELTYLSARQLGFSYDRYKLFAIMGMGTVSLARYLASGVVLVCLAAAVAGARRSGSLGLVILAFSFCLAVVLNLFGIVWILYHLPVISSFGGQGMIEMAGEVLLGVMIALGADHLFGSPRAPRWLAALGAVSILLAIAWWGIFSNYTESFLNPFEPTMRATGRRFLHAWNFGMAIQAGIGILLLGSKWIARRHPGLWRGALMVSVLGVYSLPVFLALPRQAGDIFSFPPELEKFYQSHPGLYRSLNIYPIDRWEQVQIPLQSGVLYGTRSTDAFNNLPSLRYTKFLKAIIPQLYHEEGGRLAGVNEALKVFKEGNFISNRNLRFVNFLGIRYLITERKNLKFPSHYFLAYPDSPWFAGQSGATGERRRGPGGIEEVVAFAGEVSGKVHLQSGDRLEFETESASPGRWCLALTRREGKPAVFLEFARWVIAPRFGPMEVDLGRNGEGGATLAFLALDQRGASASGLLINPTIINPAKYFQLQPIRAEFKVFENPGALPPAFLVEKVFGVNNDEVLKRLLDPDFDPAREALVEDPRLNRIPPGPLGPGEGVEVVRYTPEEVELVAAAAGIRLLVLTDTYFPGWRVWVDGIEDRVWPVNYAFRGVVLDRGRHRITLRYQPVSFHLALWITLSSLFCLSAAGIGRVIQPKRKK